MASGQTRVEMVLPDLGAGGMERVSLDLARVLIQRGIQVGFTCLAGGGTLVAEAEKMGAPVTVVSGGGALHNLFPQHFTSWFRQLAPEVVHIHNVPLLKAARAARRASVPRVVYTLHGADGEPTATERFMLGVGARYTDAVVLVTDMLRPLVNTIPWFPHDRVSCIVNGVDMSRFQGETGPDVRREIGVSPDSVVVGMVGRMVPVKNHRGLLEAFAGVAPRHDTHLLVVGDGEGRESLERMAKDFGVDARVHFVGNRTDMPDLYRAMDVLVLPSFAEGTSMALLEAMAAGVCVVATPVGGTPQVVDHEHGGWLTESPSVAHLSDALDRIIGDAELRGRLASGGRARCEQHYDLNRVVDRYLDLYGLETA